ncbi:hypothetical protein JW964_00235 [candidate division KSB1 bacterium]|nr:hypothetical protein [candidate division KSB1 bacterium]
MHKYLCYTFITIFLIISPTQAGENYLTGGANVSRFYDVDSKPLPGFALGYGHEWQKSDVSALSLGISWFCRGALLENKTIHPTIGDHVSVYDIYCRIEYLEIPFVYRRYFIKKNLNSFYWTTGLAASLSFYDASSRKLIREWYDSEFPREKADYFWNTDPDWSTPLMSSTIDLMLGAGIKWRKFGLEVQLRINILGDVDTSATVGSIDTKLLTYLINGFWYF